MQFSQTNNNAGDVLNTIAPTEDEKALLSYLGAANDMFCKLPIQHAEDQDDFRQLIHRLQDMVAARLALRMLNRT